MKFQDIATRWLMAGLVLALIGGCASTPKDPTEAARFKVDWTHPEAFADVRDNPGPSVGRQKPEEWLPLLARHLQNRADQILPKNDHLAVTFVDIKRAGAYEPWRGPQWNDVRVVKDIYPPRIDLRFTLTDAHGKPLKEGERKLTDPGFLSRGTIDNDDPLRYEKRMLDDWLRNEFGAQSKG